MPRSSRASSDPGIAVQSAVAEPVSGVESFQVDRQTPGSVVLRVSAPSAQSVEISGDFTGWSPVKLEAAGEGVWTGSFSLKPGQYQTNLRLDGGNWVVPPGLLPLKDEFGGSVGLLIIE
jgi:hypothetical protein